MSDSPIKEDVVHIDEVCEIITSPPSWIVQWGVSVFFLLIVIIIAFASIIHYPNIIRIPLKVISFNNEGFYGEIFINQNDLRKIKVGQQAQIKLASYPAEEFGMLRGRVSYIADTPNNNNMFRSKIAFINLLVTDTNRPIQLKQGMTAEADIITDEMTFLGRILNKVAKKR